MHMPEIAPPGSSILVPLSRYSVMSGSRHMRYENTPSPCPPAPAELFHLELQVKQPASMSRRSNRHPDLPCGTKEPQAHAIAAAHHSSLAQPIEQRPGQHERHETPKHVANPEVAAGTVEVAFRIRVRLERVDEHRDHGRAQQVEDEARV